MFGSRMSSLIPFEAGAMFFYPSQQDSKFFFLSDKEAGAEPGSLRSVAVTLLVARMDHSLAVSP